MSATPKASKALTRRKFLQTGMVTGFVLPSTVLGQPPNRARPKAGDWLVFDGGEKRHEVVLKQLVVEAPASEWGEGKRSGAF